jgi:hypothetical protein
MRGLLSILRAMMLRPLPCIALLGVLAFAGAPGIFQGRVYQDQNAAPGWIYVGRNGMLRKVEVSRAQVVYGASVPREERAPDAAQDLIEGAEVRVTAEQDGGGEWRALKVEIIQVPRDAKSPGPGSRKAL